MRAPRNNNKSQSSSNNNGASAISRATAITLVPNEQNVIFVGFESGAIHRLRRLNTTELQQNNQLASNLEMGYSETPVVVLEGHTATVTGLSAPVSADEVTSCSLDGTVKIWTSTTANPEGGASKRCTKTINIGAPIRCMLPHGGGGDSFFLGLTDGKIIRVENYKVVEEFTGGHIEAVSALAMAETSGALLSASLDGTVVGWDLSTRNPVYAFKGHSGHVRAAAVSGDRLYTCGTDEAFVCFNIPQDFTPPEDVMNLQSNNANDNDNNQAEDGNYDENGEEINNNDNAGADDNGAGAEGEENNNNDDENQQSQQQQQQQQNTWPNVAWIIKPAAKIHLPFLPTCLTISGNYALLGTSEKSVVCVNLRGLNSKITEYTEKVEASINAAEKKLRKIASERKKILKKRARRAVREYREAHGGGGNNTNADGEDREDGGDEEDQYDEDGNYLGRGEDEEGAAAGGGEEAEEFERQQQEEAQQKSAQVDANVAAQIARYNVLRNQFFTQPVTQFQNSSICDLVAQQREVSHKLVCKDSVLGVVAEGARVWVISGHETIPMVIRPRVRAV